MMTFFKPWRNGGDLKTKDQSWDDVFTDHTFTECQQELLRFFHIKYECNDARDDYSAARQKKGEMSPFDPIFFSDDIDDDSSFQDMLYSQLDSNRFNLEEFSEKGQKTLNKEHAMHTAENIALTSGWMDSCLDSLPLREEIPMQTGNDKRSTEWKSLLETEKELRVSERQQYAPKPV